MGNGKIRFVYLQFVNFKS